MKPTQQIIRNWQPYNGDYEKRFYDIKTFSGEVFEYCWPNAGKFHSRSGHSIDEKDVEFFIYVPINWN